MELERAKEIVTLLANGTDPVTGEVFAEDSPYNHPTVIRALYTVLNNLNSPKKQGKLSIEEKQAQNLASGKPRNSGLPWSDDLKAKVASLFQAGKPVKELAQHFERTEGAILAELVHQGIIDEAEKRNYR